MNFDLKDKVAIVTGGAMGIGEAAARKLASEGAAVAIFDLNREAGEKTAAEIRSRGGVCDFFACNVSLASDVSRAVEAVVAKHQHLDILVSNAGVQDYGDVVTTTEQAWDQLISINLKGCFLCTQHAGRHMKQHGLGGSIINIGSGCNKLAFPSLVNYTASKGGIEMFTKSAAVELGRYKIRVNCAAPGAIEVERTKTEGGDYAAIWAGLAPMGRIGLPEDVAESVVFLASPAAEFVSGQTLFIDGGVFAKPHWPYEV